MVTIFLINNVEHDKNFIDFIEDFFVVTIFLINKGIGDAGSTADIRML